MILMKVTFNKTLFFLKTVSHIKYTQTIWYWLNYWHILISKGTSGFTSNTFLFAYSSKKLFLYLCLRHSSRAWIICPQNNLKFVFELFVFRNVKTISSHWQISRWDPDFMSSVPYPIINYFEDQSYQSCQNKKFPLRSSSRVIYFFCPLLKSWKKFLKGPADFKWIFL